MFRRFLSNKILGNIYLPRMHNLSWNPQKLPEPTIILISSQPFFFFFLFHQSIPIHLFFFLFGKWMNRKWRKIENCFINSCCSISKWWGKKCFHQPIPIYLFFFLEKEWIGNEGKLKIVSSTLVLQSLSDEGKDGNAKWKPPKFLSKN